MTKPGGGQYKLRGKTHYERNKSYYVANASQRKLRNVDYLNEYKKTHPCVDCKEKDYRCLDFDHLPEFTKVCNLSDLAYRGASIERLQAEIDKCEVRCANCHRIKTFERLQMRVRC